MTFPINRLLTKVLIVRSPIQWLRGGTGLDRGLGPSATIEERFDERHICRAGRGSGDLCGNSLAQSGSRARAPAETPRGNPLRPSQETAIAQPSPVQQASATSAGVREVGVRSVQPAGPAVTRSVRPSTHKPIAYTSPVTYGSRVVNQPRGFVPRHALVSQAGVPTEATPPIMEYSEPGDMEHQGFPGESDVMGEFMSGDGCDEAVADAGGCGTCGSSSGCLIPCPRLTLDNFEFFAGVQGFTAPLNRGQTGSFGFHYGANWAFPRPACRTGQSGCRLATAA